MNQRQTLPKPRNTRQTQESSAGAVTSRPPVLFSLPDLSEPCESKSPVLANPFPASSVSNYSNRIAASVPLTKGIPKVELPQTGRSVKSDKPTQNSASFLNTAIGFLLFAMLLIGVKLYTDRVSERSRGNQRLISSSNSSPVSVVPAASTAPSIPATIPAQNPPPDRMELPTGRPAPMNVGPQRATYEAPMAPANASLLDDQGESSGSKAVLEISDPVVSASYPAEVESASSAPSPAVFSAPIPQAPVTLPPPVPAPSVPAPTNPVLPAPTSVPQAFPQTNAAPSSIPASSLNTRDMILLRQGKTIDVANRDRETKPVSLPVKTGGNGDVKLTGEAYPPIRQKYEPIGLPSSAPAVTRPTSIEVPEPPKPYQPIGASLE